MGYSARSIARLQEIPRMPEQITIELIHAAPAALWVVFALFAYLTLRPVIKRRLENVAIVRTSGFEVTFESATSLLQAATAEREMGEGSPSPNDLPQEESAPTAGERRGGIERMAHAAQYLRDRRILWVDDRPQRNKALKELFRDAGMRVDSVMSTTAAITKLKTTTYDLIITDMNRTSEGGDVAAAHTLVHQLADRRLRIPVILYSVHRPDNDFPPGLFAHTSRSDNLVQDVIDAMERIWFGIGMRVPTRRA